MRKAVCAAVLVFAALASAPADAHRVRFGFHFGFPIFAPYWYSPPPPVYYYPPPVVQIPAPAPAYVERSQAPSAAPAESWWYYCADTQTYYPYVRECASEWQRVSPRPPGM